MQVQVVHNFLKDIRVIKFIWAAYAYLAKLNLIYSVDHVIAKFTEMREALQELAGSKEVTHGMVVVKKHEWFNRLNINWETI